MVLVFSLVAVLAQAPAQPSKVKVVKGTPKAKQIAQKTQAELDAEAAEEDKKLRCADDPAACNAADPKEKEKALSAKEEALRKKEAELAAKEEALRKKQEEEQEEKEKQDRARAEAKKGVEKQSQQIESTLQGINGAFE